MYIIYIYTERESKYIITIKGKCCQILTGRMQIVIQQMWTHHRELLELDVPSVCIVSNWDFNPNWRGWKFKQFDQIPFNVVGKFSRRSKPRHFHRKIT